MRILRNVLVGGLVVLVLNGCAPDDRTSYVAPKAPASELSTLKASMNVNVDEIDGDRVGPSFSLTGHTQTVVTPGVHKLIVWVTTPGGKPPQGTGYTLTFGPQDNECYFKFICVKGHAYEFSRRSMFNNDLMVTDLNTGQKMDIESDGPD